jgi:molybdopterin molybdotransferase
MWQQGPERPLSPMLLPYDDAILRALSDLERLGSERVALDGALGRVLAENLAAECPLPPFDHSAMDGYAVRVAAFQGPGPWTLPLRAEARAGHPAPHPVLGDGACRIFTGAPIPEGADAVIIQENVTRRGDSIVTSERPVLGQNIRAAGSDLKAKAVALAAGTCIGPGQLGVLATLDRAHVLVAERPVVTFLSTGDELRLPGSPGRPGSIPESNSLVLAAAARRAGAIARVAPLVADEVGRTEEAVGRALERADLVVTIGGASVGDHDLVRPALERLGVAIDFWGIAVKPGKPTAAGRLGNHRILCVPGNPASASLAFLLFGLPMIRALQGQRSPLPRRAPMRVLGAHRRRPGREEYLRARLEIHDGEECAVVEANQASGAVTSFAAADALVVLAADRDKLTSGDRCPVIRLSDAW